MVIPLRSLRGSQFPNQGLTQAHGSESTESSLLDFQGIPYV